VAKAELKRTTDLIDAAAAILDIQQPMTIRQLFYQLVSAAWIPNDLEHYKMVSRIMTIARNDGRVPFEYITDRSRPEYKPQVFDDAAEYARVVQKSYRKDYWATQPRHVELWVEKDATVGSFDSVVDELGITIRVGRGFQSTTRAHEIGQYFGSIDKPITVFYLGDHDPAGHVIETELFGRIHKHGSGDFHLERLAIFKEDITKYKLPPQRIKSKDSNGPKFQKKYGSECVELDALPVDVLRERIKTAVEDLIDFYVWNRAKATEQAEFDSIKSTVALWQNLKVKPAPRVSR
jgi:hypothetical protein